MNFVIVPFKNFVDAKSRLRKDISDKQTRKIVKIMLEHVLAEIKKCSDSFEKYLVTKDEIPDPQNLKIWLELNGKKVQDSSTKEMIFDVDYLVSYLSRYMSLNPGDIIFTGSPPGVGFGMNPQVFLKAGDEMKLGIAGLGEQHQKTYQA